MDCVILDDETYVDSDFQQLPGQEFFTCEQQCEVDDCWLENI